MKPTKEQIEAYKEMAKTSTDSMKAMIEANLKATCDKYAGHEDRLDDCIEYLTDCAKEILGNKNGEVDNVTCYRICRDYFNDEIWAKEDQEKAAENTIWAKEDQEKAAENTKMDSKKKKAPKKAATKAMKAIQEIEKEQLDKERERLEKLKEKHGLNAAEPSEKKEKPKFQMCPVCGKEFLNLYHGMCLKCYEKRPMQAEKPAQQQTAQIQPEQGQLDLFAAMGV